MSAAQPIVIQMQAPSLPALGGGGGVSSLLSFGKIVPLLKILVIVAVIGTIVAVIWGVVDSIEGGLLGSILKPKNLALHAACEFNGDCADHEDGVGCCQKKCTPLIDADKRTKYVRDPTTKELVLDANNNKQPLAPAGAILHCPGENIFEAKNAFGLGKECSVHADCADNTLGVGCCTQGYAGEGINDQKKRCRIMTDKNDIAATKKWTAPGNDRGILWCKDEIARDLNAPCEADGQCKGTLSCCNKTCQQKKAAGALGILWCPDEYAKIKADEEAARAAAAAADAEAKRLEGHVKDSESRVKLGNASTGGNIGDGCVLWTDCKNHGLDVPIAQRTFCCKNQCRLVQDPAAAKKDIFGGTIYPC